mmetsp:Transcript_1362/g.4039  ORF Transcript_1362/g.4039 Transcript_1362/m.4039 type:complete len:360 (-) Transcript_1362:202-1281(-)
MTVRDAASKTSRAHSSAAQPMSTGLAARSKSSSAGTPPSSHAAAARSASSLPTEGGGPPSGDLAKPIATQWRIVSARRRVSSRISCRALSMLPSSISFALSRIAFSRERSLMTCVWSADTLRCSWLEASGSTSSERSAEPMRTSRYASRERTGMRSRCSCEMRYEWLAPLGSSDLSSKLVLRLRTLALDRTLQMDARSDMDAFSRPSGRLLQPPGMPATPPNPPAAEPAAAAAAAAVVTAVLRLLALLALPQLKLSAPKRMREATSALVGRTADARTGPPRRPARIISPAMGGADGSAVGMLVALELDELLVLLLQRVRSAARIGHIGWPRPASPAAASWRSSAASVWGSATAGAVGVV